ncbi:TRAP transporter large permease subunit [Tissierella sp. Yu-01]|uniref:TRAP transporter large permease subunit n=1 Tax=Tissierella sp. Yu-01 TaxID=3035694 RepID=UPI00240E897E|nr:TRAP transporter large permease subunit [Tissierella sp. Yu-01]WFA10058.1 Na+/H+ antiporter NhaC family protein [Tissierella sp. Yu-01]
MEAKELLFNLPPIVGLLPLIIYIILSFKEDAHPVVNVFVCVLLGAILVKQPILQLGSVIADSLGSFLALIGFIIILGSGLGAVLNRTGVAKNLVHILMDKIGINTERKAIIGTMVTSIVLVTLLGTMAGANAIIAPIVIPLIATMGITPSTLAVIFQGAGQTGLFLGPFSPPMVTLMEITGLPYGQILLYAGLPVSVCMWVVTYFIAKRTQKKTFGIYKFEVKENQSGTEYVATAKTKRATVVFLLVFLALIVYGIAVKSGAAYAIFIMITVALTTGVSAGLKVGEIVDAMFEGMSKLIWLFIMFVLFEPFLVFVEQSGAFDALFNLLQPLIVSSGQVVFSLVASIIGIFGINGAAVAQSMLMDSLFANMVVELNIPMGLWAAVLLIGSQITSFAYPGGDMLGAMGLAQSNDVKSMLKLGYSIIVTLLIFIIVLAVIL